MEWMKACGFAISYIEEHLSGEISPEDIAKEINMSAFYFQKGFSLLCGYTLGEYIRNRRLAVAGTEIVTTNERIIDIALKYGYDSPDSFTRAFTRFHGVTPQKARNDGSLLKTFAPLKIKFSIEGGYLMEYKIEKKKAFTVIANQKEFSYENAKNEVPLFWQEHFAKGCGKVVMGEYGINIDEKMGNENFYYLIADTFKGQDIPTGFVKREIPEFTWAIFPCVGPMPESLQNANEKIFTEWLPAMSDYEFAAGYCVEYYDNPVNYPKGTLDEKYYCEIWIPIKKK